MTYGSSLTIKSSESSGSTCIALRRPFAPVPGALKLLSLFNVSLTESAFEALLDRDRLNFGCLSPSSIYPFLRHLRKRLESLIG